MAILPGTRLGNATLAQGLNELWHEPILVSDFDRKLVALGQLLQEWPEPGKKVVLAHERLLVEIPELEQQWPEFLPESVHHLQELRHVIIAIHEHLLMRDDLWGFRSEDETLRRLLVPAFHG